MRKPVNIDKKKLIEIKYNPVPLRQIFMLDISSEAKLILSSFFINQESWNVGTIGISERTFFKEKNKKQLRAILNKLIAMGYLAEDDISFTICLDKIQEDFKKNFKIVDAKNKIRLQQKAIEREKKKALGVSGNNPSKNNSLGVSGNNPLGVSGNNPSNGVSGNNPTYYTYAGSPAPAGQECQPINHLKKSDELVVGLGVAPSAASPSGQPHPHTTPTVKDIAITKKNGQEKTEHTKTHIPNDSLHGSAVSSGPAPALGVTVNNPSNDLQYLLKNNAAFQATYKYLTMAGYDWYGCDISTYSNTEIVRAVLDKLNDTPNKTIGDKEYSMMMKMVRLSQKNPESQIWQEFLQQSNSSKKIIEKLKNS